ncbi:elongation factor P--(R)-beta-lysine ligase [Candidatus Fukatsuia anoeciicola]|uniref:elongation factor P--(R)-beta-lysine ligase n=1 Tax=Candidatus Fukatsuia anoeciicola TaxID=2994492 RepID=UPI003464E0E4
MNINKNKTVNWQPNAPIKNLRKRAAILTEIRQFFADRNVLEVETPAMSQANITDVHIVSFKTKLISSDRTIRPTLYMITSPEYHMKRLLAAGSGSIYQLGRSFRNEESGRLHNPEFTMLEWYRVGYDMIELINEVDELLQQILSCDIAKRVSYQQIFLDYLAIDPLATDIQQLSKVASKLNLSNADKEKNLDTLLQFLFVEGIEPLIGHDKPIVIYNYPASQASLAKINNKDYRIAERFEFYFKGIELANGFHELTNFTEQRQRFEQDNRYRVAQGLKESLIDENFINALQYGLPTCSGVSLGVDRLVMLALKATKLSEVMAFTIERA